MNFDAHVWKGGALLAIFLALFSFNAAAWNPADMQAEMDATMDDKMTEMQTEMDATFNDNFGDTDSTSDDSSSDTTTDSDSWVWKDSDSTSSGDDSSDSTSGSTGDSWGEPDSTTSPDDGLNDGDDTDSNSDFWGYPDDSNDDSDDSNDDSSDDSSDSSNNWGDDSGDDSSSDDSSGNWGGDGSNDDSSSSPSGTLEERTEEHLHELINNERQQRGLQSFNFDQGLRETAQYKSQDMADRDYFAHTSPTGEGFRDIYDRFGYNCRISGGYLGGENIATTWFDRSVRTDAGNIVQYDDAAELADGLRRQWMTSDGHRDAILRSYYSNHGLGVEITDSGKVYATEHFC